MGRARGTTGAASGFDGVLGVRRGSPQAQAARDAHEARARTRLGERQLRELADLLGGDSLGAVAFVDAFAAELDADLAPGSDASERLAARFARLTDVTGPRPAVKVLRASGELDPAGGLHVVCALGVAQVISDPDVGVVRRRELAQLTLAELYRPGRPPHAYAALEPVSAAVLHLSERCPDGAFAPVALAAARALCDAPSDALDGPLRPLLLIAARRAARVLLPGDELAVLQSIRTDMASDPALAAAFAPVAKHL